uniref:Uncharacterized protein n=1 Tax=Arundo donax TaxID=35708 RepID=A0A0A8YG34_ARUDO
MLCESILGYVFRN